MIPALEFSERDWQNLNDNWRAWWAGELDRPLVMIECPPRSRAPEELTPEFLLHNNI